ncbi:Brassinosteroid LRR receptor kinase, partial [Cucurbita argyrosperma subsp. argyrosperma]
MLNGTIPPELFLQSGNIAVNFITGKSYAYIKNDGSKQCHGAGNLVEFAGIRQEQVNRISSKSPCNFTRVYKGMTQPTFNHNGSMIFLDLSHNMLSGSIPKEIGSTKYLYILDLGHNRVSGGIPQELGDLTKLNILDLSSNELEGSIPLSLTGLSSLMEIDLSNNHLNGSIPESAQFETFPASGFANNSGLCGYPLPQCRVDSAANANSQHQRSHRKQASLAGSVAMGLLFSLFCIFGLIIVVIEMKKRRKNKDAALDSYIDTHSQSGNTTTVNWKNTCVRKRPTDSADFGDNNLVGWVKQHAKLDLTNVFDPELLKEDPNLKIELLEHLKVAVACLDDRSWRRPTMIQVMTMFKEIQAGSGMDSQSTIGSDNGGFSIDMVDMSLKEVPEGKY